MRRQGDALAAAGWEVAGFGLPGHRSAPPAWPCHAIAAAATSDVEDGMRKRTEPARARVRDALAGTLTPAAPRLWARAAGGFAALGGRDPAAAIWLARRGLTAGARAAVRVGGRLLAARRGALAGGGAERHYWALNTNFEEIYRLARGYRADLWLANDWTTLPIARRLAAEQGARYAYDTHELAMDEYAQDARWRLTQRPLIVAVEGAGVAGAAFVTCVSQGIAARLHEVYRLPAPPVVIRNAPAYQRCAPRPTGQTIALLYHGVVSPGRGLEACIAAMALCRAEFHLTIRGPAAPDYLDRLRALVADAGVAGRVRFDLPVPMIELVARAAEFDVGLFALPGHSEQNVHVLPNKFFEYTMAGLALCISNLPEMSALLHRYDLGEEISAAEPGPIAEAINRLDPARVDRFKHNALAAARELNWDAESRKLLALCAAAVGRSPVADAPIGSA
ncbi:MAG: glycosyltransferase [Methylobacteriaceae bacterium]|nr:glycosyltransferase [Methylobacteriaceae bacterium]